MKVNQVLVIVFVWILLHSFLTKRLNEKKLKEGETSFPKPTITNATPLHFEHDMYFRYVII